MDFPILSSLILLPIVGAIFLLFIKDINSKKNLTIKYVYLFLDTLKIKIAFLYAIIIIVYND